MTGKPRMEIITQRLRLIPMTLPFLQALESRAYKEAEAIGGFRIPRAEVLSDHVIALRIKMLLTDPLQAPWLLRAMVPCEEPVMIGDVGFHCKAPDPDLL